jgi:hypothetical protein
MALAPAVLAQLLGVFLIGPGEGWNQPFDFSPALSVIYPIVFVRLRAPDSLPWFDIDILLLGLAILLDILLVRAIFDDRYRYFSAAMSNPAPVHEDPVRS